MIKIWIYFIIAEHTVFVNPKVYDSSLKICRQGKGDRNGQEPEESEEPEQRSEQ